jgi:signal transduction histidine kinase
MSEIEREQFLALVAHELRSPVQALLLHLEATLLLGAGQPDATAWMRGRTERALGRVRELATQLDRFLDAGRVQADRIDLAREDVDLAALAREAVARMRDELGWAGCAVSVAAPPEVRGRWDPARLDAVVTNLVGNARKFAAGKPIGVRVEDDGRLARLVVEDRGPGVPAEHRERIFERFERIARADGPQVAGLGLGLWIARRFVEAHGGSLTVADAPEGGAQFTVTLPRD